MDNTTTGSVRVELWLEAIRDGNATIEVTVQDSGTGMSDKRLGALFRDLEQVTSEKSLRAQKIVMTT
jgi:signal transduction histidine kinase